jgi:hypothetical protein
MKMNKYSNFTIHLEEPNCEKYADPPDDSLGELSHFELGLKLFCFECDSLVSIEIGQEKVKVFLDPDICMVLEDELPQKLSELSQGKSIKIEFVESVCLTLKLQPLANNRISCNFQKFGYCRTTHANGRQWRLHHSRRKARISDATPHNCACFGYLVIKAIALSPQSAIALPQKERSPSTS